MNFLSPAKRVPPASVFYDAQCGVCSSLAKRAGPILKRHGFILVDLQRPGLAERLHVSPSELASRIHVELPRGGCLSGADAVLAIMRTIPWARPLVLIAGLPGILPLLRRAYDFFAARRYQLSERRNANNRFPALSALPLLLFPLIPFAFREQMAGWVFMWALAIALFSGFKWLTYRGAVANEEHLTFPQALGYLCGWVGMEPRDFLRRHRVPRAGTRWMDILARLVFGTGLVWLVVRWVEPVAPLAAGWIGMLGMILLLHFGLFELLARAWQRAGVPVKPLMCAPLRATSLGDFWGARWNTGFHALARVYMYRPLHRFLGRTPALFSVFLISGLIHELVITVPARGGFGLPTVYFLAQALGLFLERSRLGRRLGLGAGIKGRVFALTVAAVPAFGLFPPVFVRNIILPMLDAIGAF